MCKRTLIHCRGTQPASRPACRQRLPAPSNGSMRRTVSCSGTRCTAGSLPTTLVRQKSLKRAVEGTGAKPLTTGVSSCGCRGQLGSLCSIAGRACSGAAVGFRSMCASPQQVSGTRCGSGCQSNTRRLCLPAPHLLPPMLLSIGLQRQGAGMWVLRHRGAHMRRRQPLAAVRPPGEPGAAAVHHHGALQCVEEQAL
jgi:hypothetical protein